MLVARKESEQYYKNHSKPKRVRSFPATDKAKFLRFIKDGNRPEDYSGLNLGPISRDIEFVKIVDFEINRKARRGQDIIPCAMCSPNKFLSGSLIWLEEIKSIAIIGHCCANSENQIKANKEFKAREAFDQAEGNLLKNLPLVPRCLEVISDAKAIASAQQNVHRELQRSFPLLCQQLRDVKRLDGQLYRVEEVDSNYRDAGSSHSVTSGGMTTRRVSYGMLQGETAILRAYRPIQELRILEQHLSAFTECTSETEALNHIVKLSTFEAVKADQIVRSAGASFAKIKQRMDEFRRFFDREHIKALDNWGGTLGRMFSVELTANGTILKGRDDQAFASVRVLPDAFRKVGNWPIDND